MAVRPKQAPQSSKRTWFVAATLLVLFVAALFLRAYWNIDAATQDGEFVLSAGSDPYYHKRAIDHIQENGFETLIDDPMLNYPYGSVNPNPPLFQWMVAVTGHYLAPFFDATDTLSSEQVATWYTFLWSPAVLGALTLFPIYFIGAALFNRKAGLLAALFWTISTTSIDTTGLGSADHDAAIMFFASFAFLFYIKAIQQFSGDAHWVTRWSDGSAVASGIGRFFRERRLGLTYALLAGVALGAVALTWKGFPYVIGIVFAYAGLQMVLDHWRSKDSTGLFVGTFLMMLVGTLVAVPYYNAAGVANFLQTTWFLIAGFFIAGLVLVPTRDLPTILVMPAALVAAAVGLVVAFFVTPTVATSLLYSTVYFKQTALYQTIAEAHPADFSTLVFSVGPLPYFLAIFGFFTLLFTMKKHPGRATLFAIVWAVIALFMARSAIRFVFNALPVIAVFAGYGTAWVLDWLDFGSIRRSLSAHPGAFWQGFRKGTRPLHIVAAVLLALLLVVPNTILAADAAIPAQKEAQLAENTDSKFLKNFYEQRLGAYGQGFIPPYWQEGLTWLDEYDSGISDPAARPAFLSWWDYGHWAIYVGKHPAVADNFQNGYVYAANFLLAQNETQAVQLMAARYLAGDWREAPQPQLAPPPGLVSEARGIELLTPYVADPSAALAALRHYEFAPDLDLAESAALLASLEAETGQKIRYFTVDIRMLPYDNPQTPSIEQGSIFYAPVVLAGKSPDDYVTQIITLDGRPLTQDQYKEAIRDPIRQHNPGGEYLDYQQKFYNSMYWRAYAGTMPTGTMPTKGDAMLDALNRPAPGLGLTHFRLVYQNDGLKTLEYFPGAKVSGTVLEDGQPVADVRVTAYDDAGQIIVEGIEGLDADLFNVAHGSALTDATGHYEVVAPFAMPGGNVTFVATKADGTEVARGTLPITRNDAQTGASFTLDLTVQLGNVEGRVFEDTDGNGAFDEANETVLEGVTVTIAGKSAVTNATGHYSLTDLSPGTQNVTTDRADRDVGARSTSVRIRGGDTVTHLVALIAKPATVSGFLYADEDNDGARNETEGTAFTSLEFTADETVEGNTAVDASAFTNSDGSYTVNLRPGTYTATATTTLGGTAYTVTESLVVIAGEAVTRDFRMTAS